MIKVLDWAGRRGDWWPACAGLLISCAYAAVQYGTGWLWLPAGLGLVTTAVRPAGTSLRRRLLIRECRQLLTAARENGRDGG